MASTLSSNKQNLLIFAGVVLATFLLLLYIDSQASKMAGTLKANTSSPPANAPNAASREGGHDEHRPEEKLIIKEDPVKATGAPRVISSSASAADAEIQANEKRRQAANQAADAATKRKYSQAAAPASAPSTITLSINIEGDDPNAPWHRQSEEKLERVDFDPKAPYLTAVWITFLLLMGALGRSAHGLWHVRRGDVLRRGAPLLALWIK